MEKIYCYVDESGQHSQGSYFLVSVIIAADNRDQLAKQLLAIEKKSGKNRRKWSKAGDRNRSAYMQAVLTNPDFKSMLFTAHYQDTQEYVQLTIETTAQAIQQQYQEDYQANIIVDGLHKKERNRFAVGLRRKGIRTNKVRGADDERDPFIRLADALCGFVADAIQGRADFQQWMKQAEHEGILKLLPSN